MFAVVGENDTGFPARPVTSLVWDGCWTEPARDIVSRCEEMHSKPSNTWELCLPSLFLMFSHLFPIQALNFIFLKYKSVIQSYFCTCSICISMILILQVLCWCPDILFGQLLQHWESLELGPASVGKARPPLLLQHLKLSPALWSSKMCFNLGLKPKEEAEVQLGSGLHPPGLSSMLVLRESKCSMLGLLCVSSSGLWWFPSPGRTPNKVKMRRQGSRQTGELYLEYFAMWWLHMHLKIKTVPPSLYQALIHLLTAKSSLTFWVVSCVDLFHHFCSLFFSLFLRVVLP